MVLIFIGRQWRAELTYKNTTELICLKGDGLNNSDELHSEKEYFSSLVTKEASGDHFRFVNVYS